MRNLNTKLNLTLTSLLAVSMYEYVRVSASICEYVSMRECGDIAGLLSALCWPSLLSVSMCV